jgi:two-component system response regulator YesN
MYNTLIVDDDRAVRYLLKKSDLFLKNGFVITGEAEDGKEALEKVKAFNYDIILVDIRMPKINGLEFIQELRRSGYEICVVIISGYDDFSYTRQAVKLGAFDYLLKPIANIDLDELLANARSYLNSKNISKNIERNTSIQITESLMLPYSKQDEQKLYKVITRTPENSTAYALEILNRLCDFYENNTFKISVILNTSLKNLNQLMVSEIPWIENLSSFDQDIHLQQIDNIYILKDTYLEQIQTLSNLIIKLHVFDSNSIVKLLCEYIASNVDRKITLETAAETLKYSSKYLGKIFKEFTGESIVDYITKVKMERAKLLVLSGKYKNYEITEILGYKNPDYFTKLFKEYHGYTPLGCKKSSITSDSL